MENIDKSLLNNPEQDQPGKPPAAKPLPSRWIPEDNPTPTSNDNLNQPFDTRTDTFQQRFLG